MFGPINRYELSPARSYTPPPEANVETYLTMADTLGLERMVIVHPTPYGAEHACTADSVEALGRDRTRAVAVIDEGFSRAMVEDLDRKGFCAARINSVTSNGTPLSQLQSVAKLVAHYGWHIELYTQCENLPALAPTLVALPVPVVIDHMGRIPADRGINCPEFQALLRLLNSGRCWVKLCGYRNSIDGPPYGDLFALARHIVKSAPERCVWGTDWPHPGLSKSLLPDDGKLLDLLYDWAPGPDQVRRVLVENPTELYGFRS
jgi:predicted TIM-barrel fold metal-dependent hydrolase